MTKKLDAERPGVIHCRTNPREVEAMLWDGVSIDAVKAWGCYTTKPDENGSIYIGALGEEELVCEGWWIVKDPDADLFWPEPPEKFDLWFVPLPRKDFGRMAQATAESTWGKHDAVGRVYVSGPMTGYDDLNYPAFEMATKQLRALGYVVINPHEINPKQGLSYENCMKADIAALLLCDAIALLPGYETSKGAQLETAIGRVLNMKIGLYSAFLFEPEN